MKTDLISRSELFNKLANVPIKAESVETTTEIFKIINSMPVESVGIAESAFEQICDEYCKFPYIAQSQDDLERICDNCPLDEIASARIEPGSDLISRADAIEAVKQAIYNHDSAIMRITSLPSASVEVGEWIPVSERLPKEYAQYLVYFESGHCYVYWLEDSDWARGMAEKEGIIAWMPLPKPYREEEANETD